jgi:two-component system, NarL family, sensor histidine kinase UhpB
MRNSNNKLRAFTHKLDETAQKEKRNIALEIHDELGHLLTILKYEMENLIKARDMTVESMKEEVEAFLSMVDSLQDSVRKIIADLHPGIIDILGLIPTIEWQLNTFHESTRIICHFHFDEIEWEFPNTERIIVYRILQEILTNVARHSDASELNVSVRKKEDMFVLTVSDNGKGFMFNDIHPQNSFGLIGMRERALGIGGRLTIKSKPGKGTTVILVLKKTS